MSGGVSKQGSNQSNASQNYGSGQNYSSNTGVNFGLNQSGSSGSSSQDVWGGQSPYLTGMYGSANDAYNQAMGGVSGMMPQVAGQVQGAYGAGSGAYNNLAGGGQQAQLLNGMGANPYVDAMKDQVASDADRLKQQTLASTDARAAAAGMSGSSGYRNQVNDSFSNIDGQAMDAMSNIGYNSFNQDMQNRMALAQGIDSNYANAAGMTSNMQGAAMNQFNPFTAGLGVTGQYAGILGGPTVLGSSTNNSFSNGMNMGVNMGGSMGNNQNWGNSSGSGSSSGWGLNGGII